MGYRLKMKIFKFEDDVSKRNFASSSEAKICNNTFFSTEADYEGQIFVIDKVNPSITNIDQNSWLYEDYSEQIEEEEI